MWEHRITKYNPNKRDEFGRYLDAKEWTEFSEVGENVSLEEYERVETLYVDAAHQLITGGGIKKLKLIDLEDNEKHCPYRNNETITIENLKHVVRSILRREYWAKLESDIGFIHIGWDYYMYVGTEATNELAIRRIADSGLYVEQTSSPYNEQDS